ncbi:MAG: FkbM family methyltransferase [Bacteroidota bacterium]
MMAIKQQLDIRLNRVQKLATTSVLGRLMANPIKYISALAFKKLIYPLNKESKPVTVPTFFGEQMNVLLPASTDIYLTGGKSHDSEIRLARYLIHTLQSGDLFFDIGAHYGYFSMLAAHLVGPNGKIVALEAAPRTYKVLAQNARAKSNIFPHHSAVAEKEQTIAFYEFENMYSEYNTFDIQQFEGQAWLQQEPYQKLMVPCLTVDQLADRYQQVPKLIKIDVEGAEYQVLLGAKQLLATRRATIVMEYLPPKRGNQVHQQAAQLLQEFGYQPFTIDQHGKALPCPHIEQYFEHQSSESDNIVFQKHS